MHPVHTKWKYASVPSILLQPCRWEVHAACGRTARHARALVGAPWLRPASTYHRQSMPMPGRQTDPRRVAQAHRAAAAPRQDQPGPLQRGDDAEPIVLDDEDEELRRALAASMQGARRHRPPCEGCREFQQI